MWYRLASHLKMTVQEAQERITSSEFVEWNSFLSGEMNTLSRGDFYLAQIAAEVRRGYVKNPRKVKIEDMLISFRMESGEGQEDTVEDTVKRSKAFWLGPLNLPNAPTQQKVEKNAVDVGYGRSMEGFEGEP